MRIVHYGRRYRRMCMRAVIKISRDCAIMRVLILCILKVCLKFYLTIKVVSHI